MTWLDAVSAIIGGLCTLAASVIVIIRLLKRDRNATSADQAKGHDRDTA
jgi:hypothetical protein